MFFRWSVKDFKSFRGAESLRFAPLTLLCGPNSSGESSIVQSILLIKQTILYSPIARPIALNGPLVRLGVFSDIENFEAQASNTNEEHSIGFGWELSTAHRLISSDDDPMHFRTAELSTILVDFSIDIAREGDAPGPSDAATGRIGAGDVQG